MADPHLALPDRATKLWRYMDLAQFLAWVTTGRLWFARADTFEDTFEMAFPTADLPVAQADTAELIRRGELPRDMVRQYLMRLAGLPQAAVDVLDDDDLARQMLRYFRRFLFLSCWYQADHESAGMWDLYVRSREGVAVRTTVGALIDALDAGTDGYFVTLGAVAYLDYDRESWGPYHAFSAAFHKRRSFEHESEVRAAIVWPTYGDLAAGRVDVASHPIPPGLSIPLDLGRLADEILVSPRASGFLSDALTRVLAKFEVPQVPVRSTLYSPPTF
jgi:hypothetical protein